MTKLKVFIDTNVWFSAFYGSENCKNIIVKHISNKFQGVISQDVLNELIRNVADKIPQEIPTLKKLLEAKPPKIIKSPEKIDKKLKAYVDFKDQHIFQSAINSKCDYFVTGNLKDFNIKKLEELYEIKVISPLQLLSKIYIKLQQ